MIKFFRKIRQKLLAENKVRRYLIYAIGEIILVVIGILIAIKINNWNEAQQKEKNVLSTLEEIQDELLLNITNTNEVFDSFIFKDSMNNLVFNNGITYEDYKNNYTVDDEKLIIYFYEHYRIQDYAFNKLIGDGKSLPKAYLSVIDSLKHLYQGKTFMDILNKRAENVVFEQIDYLFKNKEWAPIDAFKYTMSDAQINFYLTDPLYKSQVSIVMNDNANIFARTAKFRKDATDVYQLVSKRINKDSEIPDSINYTLNDSGRIKQFVGEYQLVEGDESNVFGEQLRIGYTGNQLEIIYSNNQLPIFYYRDNMFYLAHNLDRFNSIFKFKSDEKGYLSIINGRNEPTKWQKIE